MYDVPLKQMQAVEKKALARAVKEEVAIKTIVLDTLKILNENFVRNKHHQAQKDVSDVNGELPNEAEHMPSISLPSVSGDQEAELHLKYMPNSSINYIHDLKVTDYHVLYFNNSKFISVTQHPGLTAAYANKEDARKDLNYLEAERAYYLHEALADALLLFVKEKYGACLTLLQKVGGFTGNDINCRFYSAMCYYHQKNYPEAIRNFETCINDADNVFMPESEFYKAVCLYESGKPEEAKPYFEKIINEKGFYFEKAKAYMK
jgi:tetratricopeptide (TPR) repeat protein